jgi:hypothetical protein
LVLSHEHGERQRERDALGRQLESDRTAVADCITKANRELDSRYWLTECRGSYEWNDDRYQEEFLAAGLAIRAALAPMTKIAANWSGCPMSSKDIATARINLEQERDQAIRGAKEAETRLRASATHGVLRDLEKSLTQSRQDVRVLREALTAIRERLDDDELISGTFEKQIIRFIDKTLASTSPTEPVPQRDDNGWKNLAEDAG